MELRRTGNAIEMVEEHGGSSEEGQDASFYTPPEMPTRADLAQATERRIYMLRLFLGLCNLKVVAEFKSLHFPG